MVTYGVMEQMQEPTSPGWMSPLAADKPTDEPMRTVLREVLETLALTVLIFALVSAVFQTFKVEGRSMEPTLHNDEYLIINKASYWRIDPSSLARLAGVEQVPVAHSEGVPVFGEPKRGDVIVFKFPRDLSRPFIKRIIGLPGETVEIRNGQVLINGEELEEPYLRDQPRYHVGPEVVPHGNYFVLGDNRNNSSDSHVWGMVPQDNILGKAWVRYWPLRDLAVNLSPAPHLTSEQQESNASSAPSRK